jgi:hypothetical protein
LSTTAKLPGLASLLRIAAHAIAIATLAGATAFCWAQGPATSRGATPVPRVPNPSLAPPTQPALQPLGPYTPPVPVPIAPSALPPLQALPPSTTTEARPQPAPTGEGDIALVLPLESPDYARAAQAVRDGFVAAARAAGQSKRVKVVGHGDGNVLGGFEGARSLGARIVVGPLVRDDVRALVDSESPLPVTLALNQLDDATPLPPQLYTLALSVESDARVLARRMRADNLQNVVIIGGETPLMKRFAGAFAAQWLLAGGGAPNAFGFDASPDGLSLLRRELARAPADAALIALDGSQAPLARSFVPRLPAYASSLVNQDHDPAAQRDLEGVVFVDVPWLVTPDHPTLAKLPREPMGNRVLDRLYALGLDAFAVASAFADGVPEQLTIDGATGRLTLGEGRHIVREGTLAVFRQGAVVPLDAR